MKIFCVPTTTKKEQASERRGRDNFMLCRANSYKNQVKYLLTFTTFYRCKSARPQASLTSL